MFGFSFYLKDIVEIARPHMKYYVYAVMYTLLFTSPVILTALVAI